MAPLPLPSALPVGGADHHPHVHYRETMVANLKGAKGVPRVGEVVQPYLNALNINAHANISIFQAL